MEKVKTSEMSRVSVETFKEQEKMPVVLVLDNVRSMNNVGSIFRTADAFSIEAIYLCGITGCPPHREIEKTALGATSSVHWKHLQSTKEALLRLKESGYELIAVEQVHQSISLSNFKPDVARKYALIFGNEVNGVSEEALALVNNCIEIPQFGTKHSFNVVVSAGIVLWDFFSKMKR